MARHFLLVEKSDMMRKILHVRVLNIRFRLDQENPAHPFLKRVFACGAY